RLLSRLGGHAAVDAFEPPRRRRPPRSGRRRPCRCTAPRRRRVAERDRQAVPQPVLDLVHSREEERGEKRRRNPDHRSEPDESEICAAAEGGLGHASVPTSTACAAAVWLTHGGEGAGGGG